MSSLEHTDPEFRATDASFTHRSPNGSICRPRGSSDPTILPSAKLMGSDTYEASLMKYKQYSNNFSMLILAGTEWGFPVAFSAS